MRNKEQAPRGRKQKNPLRRRILRELRQDLGKNLVLFLFMTIVIGFVSGFQVADLSMQTSYHAGPERYHLEDGHFATEAPLTKAAIKQLEEDEDIAVYPLFYKEVETEEGDTYYVFNYEERRENNRPCLMEGALPRTEEEVVMDRLYCENHKMEIGDRIRLGEEEMRLVGTVALPDYTSLFKNNSDMMYDASAFSHATVTAEGFESLGEEGLHYRYLWYYEEEVSENDSKERSEEILGWLDDHFREENAAKAMAGESEFNYVTDFLQRGDNQAINFAGEDLGADMIMITVLFYILMLVLAFLFFVTTKSTVEREASAIGTLRASGFTKGELLRHYMMLPALLTLGAALLGNLLGYTLLKDYAAGLYYHSYSLAAYETLWNGRAFLMTTVVPVVIVLLVEGLGLLRALRFPPLRFLRGELSKSKKGGVRPLRRGSFLHRFRLRVAGQNIGSYVILFFGLSFASLILIFGTALVPLLEHFSESIDESKIADYQYVLKAEVESKNPRAEKYALATLMEEKNDEEVMLYGVEPRSRYVDLSFEGQEAAEGSKEDPLPVYVSTNYMKKFHLEEGDVVELKEKYSNRRHYFKLQGGYRYDAALAFFLPRSAHNRLFGEEEEHFSGYFTDERLEDVDEELVASVITEEDLKAVSRQMQDSMGGLMRAMRVFCFLAYVLLIYLLTKVIVDRNARNIGLMKILGYTNREVGSLYSRTTGILVVLMLVAILPLVYYAFALIWDYVMLRMHGYLILWLPPWMMPFLLGMGLLAYFLTYPLLMRRVRHIPPGIILKGME